GPYAFPPKSRSCRDRLFCATVPSRVGRDSPRRPACRRVNGLRVEPRLHAQPCQTARHPQGHGAMQLRPLESLPPALVSRIGANTGLPARELLSTFLSKQDLEWDFAANLWQPLSRANDNDPNAPMARYFVIHDTSGPNFGRRPFPPDIDVDPRINNL